jgi:hypothetical protein
MDAGPATPPIIQPVKLGPVAAVGVGACALPLAACFPDYQVGAGVGARDAGDAAADSAANPDSGGGTIVLEGTTTGYLTYPAPTMLHMTYSLKHAGDLLLVGTYIQTGSSLVTSLTDSQSNSFSSLSPQVGGESTPCSGNSVNVQLWYAKAAAAGGDTITVSYAGGDTLGAFVLEYSGLGAGASLDGTAGASGTVAGTVLSSGNLGTTGATDLIVALFADVTQYGTMTAGSGFTARQVDTGFVALIEDDLPAGAAPGMHAAGATLPPLAADGGVNGGDECWVALAAAFR